MRAFAERGVALTLNDVAEEAEVSREAVRHYFPTVSALLLEMQDRYDHESSQGDEGVPLTTQVKAAIRNAYADRGSAALTAMLTAMAVIEPDGPMGQAMRERTQRLRDQLTTAVQEAQQAGEFRRDIDGAVLAQLLLAATQGLAAQVLITDEPGLHRTAVPEALTQLFGPPPGTGQLACEP